MKRLSNYKVDHSNSFGSADDFIEYARQYYSSDFPNAERAGCPDPAVIIELTESNALPGEGLRSHLFSCSECFLSYKDARVKHRKLSNEQLASWWDRLFLSLGQKPALIGASVFIAAFACAGVFIIKEQMTPQVSSFAENLSNQGDSQPDASSASILGLNPGPDSVSPKGLFRHSSKNIRRTTGWSSGVQHKGVYVRINLRASVLRGANQLAPIEGKPIKLSPSRTSFLITLPVSSLKGAYQVSIVNAFGKQIVSGRAISLTGKSLKISLDLRSLMEERYRLCVSRAREIPDCYQVTIINKR
jgi:hypothetical protein